MAIQIKKWNHNDCDPVTVKSIQEKVGGIICVHIELPDTHKYIDISLVSGDDGCTVHMCHKDGDEEFSTHLDLIGLEYDYNYDINIIPLKYEYWIHLIPTEILYNKGKEIEWENIE